jgi:hypothetical protein
MLSKLNCSLGTILILTFILAFKTWRYQTLVLCIFVMPFLKVLYRIRAQVWSWRQIFFFCITILVTSTCYDTGLSQGSI